MPFSLRREYAQLVTSGAQLLLLFAAIQFEAGTGSIICLGLMALISVPAWLSALKRLRLIRDTPTSKIASAAQGYVELLGHGQTFGDTPVYAKLSQTPCLWYRYTVARQTERNKWVIEERGESDDSFVLRDDSGHCVVDPERAEITTQHRDQWSTGNYRYTEWKILQQDNIYVLGDFRTQSVALEFDSRAELNALLAEWKRDMPSLRKRFDLNKDGELDMEEWLLARQAAKREVTKKLRDAQAQPDLHIISQPRDGKLFLISNLTPEKLARRYWLWTWAHLGIFFGALIGMGWIMQMGD